jgi:UDP-glucose 4-epimerase
VTILVTGALGAIGSQVLRRLVHEGHRPVAFDARYELDLIADIAADVTIEIGDVRDWTRLAEVVRNNGVDTVVHMAALLPDQAQREPWLALNVNVGGTATICELARVVPLRRVVFSSSKGVYRTVTDECGHPTYKPLGEDYAIGPDGVYDVTKFAAEQLGLNYRTSHGVDFIALRFAATYGPGRMERHGALSIRSAIVENAYFGRPTRVLRGGEQIDDFVYTKDVAQGLVRAATVERTTHHVFNIGTGLPSTLWDAAEVIRARYPDADIEIGSGTDYGATGRYCVFDIARARDELGYEPEFDHAHGIDDYLDELEKAGAPDPA